MYKLLDISGKPYESDEPGKFGGITFTSNYGWAYAPPYAGKPLLKPYCVPAAAFVNSVRKSAARSAEIVPMNFPVGQEQLYTLTQAGGKLVYVEDVNRRPDFTGKESITPYPDQKGNDENPRGPLYRVTVEGDGVHRLVPYEQRAKEGQNRVFFANEFTALMGGFKPCSSCFCEKVTQHFPQESPLHLEDLKQAQQRLRIGKNFFAKPEDDGLFQYLIEQNSNNPSRLLSRAKLLYQSQDYMAQRFGRPKLRELKGRFINTGFIRVLLEVHCAPVAGRKISEKAEAEKIYADNHGKTAAPTEVYNKLLGALDQVETLYKDPSQSMGNLSQLKLANFLAQSVPQARFSGQGGISR